MGAREPLEVAGCRDVPGGGGACIEPGVNLGADGARRSTTTKVMWSWVCGDVVTHVTDTHKVPRDCNVHYILSRLVSCVPEVP